MMPVVYVAGPYRGPNKPTIEMNINAAMHLGRLCVRKGWSPIIPQANTAHLDETMPGLPDQFWLDATMELLRRSDAVVLVSGWEHSQGTMGEIEEARKLGIPVYAYEHVLPTAEEFIQLLGDKPVNQQDRMRAF